MAKHKCDCPPGPPIWLTSWGDICTLLLTFFVLLVTMASFNPVKVAAIVSEIQGESAAGALENSTASEFLIQIVKESAIRAKTPEAGARPELAGESLRVMAHRDNYVVRFSEQDFFERFRVTLTDSGRKRVEALARKLKDSINVVHIIGRISGDENEDQFQKLLQTVQLRDGTAARVLAVPFETFKPGQNGAALNETQTALIQSRIELASKRAETVSGLLQAMGVSRARIRETAIDSTKPIAEDTFEKQEGAGNFVFAYGGPDIGRTVEIVITGEVVLENK